MFNIDNRLYLNDGWSFQRVLDEQSGKLSRREKVRLPHSNITLPFNYFDENDYQFVSTYEKELKFSQKQAEEFSGKLLFLTFEGAAHHAEVYINEKLVCTHDNGYTAFSVEIGKELNLTEKNKIKVILDSRESLNIPPFGHVIDYLTYGGLYREVYIDIKNPTYICDVFVRTKSISHDIKTIEAEVTVISDSDNNSDKTLSFTVYDNRGKAVATLPNQELSGTAGKFEISSGDFKLWSVDEPNMYTLETVLKINGEVTDTSRENFGIRTAQFRADGFYLNGEKIKLRGLNRHQSFAYVGYAMPRSAQENDAYILKNELSCNAVRTSHYPQSKYFLDACDKLGLLVFTESPGWQYIGDDDWKKQHLKNVEEMVLQYRNHPSIVLWGVRVNESQDDNKLYKKSNQIAHELDDTRQTSGVRFIPMSNLLEDVYAYNDFSHTGNNAALQPKQMVTPKAWKPYLVSEYNGHMFPTKSYDCEEHRLSHALRHANVLNSMYDKKNGVSGCFGWCMFDYNTHKDFGSGDKICYHGVMDMFRNSKLAAAVYASQGDSETVLEVSSSMDIGEHPGGCLGDVYVFTNANYIKLYKNDEFVADFFPDNKAFPSLPHPPVKVNDFIGCLLVEKEGLSEKSSDGIKTAVKGYMSGGIAGVINPKSITGLGGAMIRDKISISKGMDLFYKYVGNWGSDVTVYRFDAIRDGKVVGSVTKAPVTEVRLTVDVSSTKLVEDTTYDVACVRISAVSENGNVLTYCNNPITLEVDGPIELIGPSIVPLRGGFAGTYVKTTGKKGTGKLTIKSERIGTRVIKFTVDKKR